MAREESDFFQVVHSERSVGGVLSEACVEGVFLYLIPVEVRRDFSFGSWPRRIHCIVEFRSGGCFGYGEFCLPPEETVGQDVPESLRKALSRYGCLSFPDCFRRLVEDRRMVPDKILEAAEMALWDLAGKTAGVPATELLGLPPPQPVPGLCCVLRHDPAEVEAAIADFLEHDSPVTHIKLKLFGETGHDCELIRAARKAAGDGCLLAGDVNFGYTRQIPRLKEIMRRLADAGLDACEDPADMDWEAWQELQAGLPELNLIPDFLMRPAYQAIVSARPAAGMVCNLHPDCMGSISAAAALARRLASERIPVMVGDDSLVGAGCSGWQQLAGAFGACWVEALEKPRESTCFPDCVEFDPVVRDAGGRFGVPVPSPGFGLVVDRRRLAAATRCCPCP